eukprot:450467-Amphidinium_carterae.1
MLDTTLSHAARLVGHPVGCMVCNRREEAKSTLLLQTLSPMSTQTLRTGFDAVAHASIKVVTHAAKVC